MPTRYTLQKLTQHQIGLKVTMHTIYNETFLQWSPWDRQPLTIVYTRRLQSKPPLFNWWA